MFPPLRYAVEGLIPEGSTLFAGPPKVGKRWFLLGCALAIASGGRVLGCLQVEPRPVLYMLSRTAAGACRNAAECSTLADPSRRRSTT